MTLPTIMHCKITTGESDVTATLAAYTHTAGCGYPHAWRDPYNQLLVWYYPTCPVETVITGAKAAIATFVTAAATVVGNMATPSADIHKLMISMMDSVYDSVSKWLNDNTTQDIIDFLQTGTTLRGYILAELIAQGAVVNA